MSRTPARDHFYRHVMEPSDGCRIWPFSVTKGGYGKLNVDGRIRSVHVVVAEMWHGERPDGMVAAHTCGVAACWAGEHIRWCTQAENLADKHKHGTAGIGERNPRALLTEDQARAIKFGPGGRSEVAAQYGISPLQVTAIRKGRAWAHLSQD